ncbi:EAL domain-containing protein [Parvularcula dongshanensis]|uniref:EAL domain-containing protein (Putative c-di-GMP-specific phosphodiesterase class I) n=1 Tax=Parvularcula dongshanensis TaxID=1173995 RepID=A0A840HYV6_9PROT|nr:EAL domain-containing protein [Parvularcula dongshanensis]MBB4657759.1 EAL domain-containing protein (putative c-di-GMP-specific phosphodiesterase class I) [Parvularcula dongshanensis]
MSAQAVRLTEVDIDNALANDHLSLVFQPLFAFEDGDLLRMEVFIRWDHPGLGSLPPGAFISFFEAQGRMGDLTRYIVRQAARQYKAWRGTSGPGCSINLAQSDLTDQAFPDDLADILREEGLPAELLTLECPPLPGGPRLKEVQTGLARLAETGCPLAIEVRGAPPADLAALSPFPFAEIKTGGAAILRFARTAKGGASLEAVEQVIALAKTHDARAVAVGVEDAESALALKGAGFDGGQGKHLAAAGSLEGFSAKAINEARLTLGLEPLSQEALGTLLERVPAEPLLLEETAEETADASEPAAMADDGLSTAEPDAGEPAAEAEAAPAADATALAIARLKARKIAAKKLAMRQAESARKAAEAERSAARVASETARRLQERLAKQVAAEDDDDAETDAPHPMALALAAPAGRPDEPEDEHAGVLMTESLAQAALGLAKTTSFADGIRIDGYGGGTTSGALAPMAEPAVREGGAAPASFSSMASAIHKILDELPVPKDQKSRLRQSAEMTLEAPALPSQPAPAEALAEFDTPEDRLDAVVAEMPVLGADTITGTEGAEPLDTEAAGLAARLGAPRRKKKNFLTRKYKITHFWPRGWVRAHRRRQAVRATKLAAITAA